MQELNFANRLYYNYHDYKEVTFTSKRIKHSDILLLIEKLKNKNNFSIKKAGTSIEGRDIFLISTGKGRKKIFLWSQMHGDESTATMAIFDIINFFNAKDGFGEIRKKILKKLTICFMPMVNPDGAEVFERRNVYDIDINRDAVRQQTPEGRILRKAFENIEPDFGFNLHDQNSRYSVGRSPNTAALSFLAPPMNYKKSVNQVRKNAIKLIVGIYGIMQKYIPGHIAKYPDDFEPRAFGDNFQKWGTSTILIESGGWKNDPEKQFLRKLNFIAILSSFKSIAEGNYKKLKQAVYDEIPFNGEFIFNTLLRNLEVVRGSKAYKVDIGINHEEINVHGSGNFYYRGTIEDIGDLSTFYGNNDFDFTGYTVEPGKIYNKEFNSLEEIEKFDFKSVYKTGCTDVILNTGSFNEAYTNLPVNIWIKKFPTNNRKIVLGDVPNLIIRKKDVVKYVVINGFVHEVNSSEKVILNGLVFQ
jgi:Zinc carboxypeptidase